MHQRPGFPDVRHPPKAVLWQQEETSPIEIEMEKMGGFEKMGKLTPRPCLFPVAEIQKEML